MKQAKVRITCILVCALLFALCAIVLTGCKKDDTPATKTDYTITYDTDGGTLSTGEPSTYTKDGVSALLPIPTKEGYRFVGWYLGEDTATLYTSVPTSLGTDLTFKALWTVFDGYTVTYHTNGGTLETTEPSKFMPGDDAEKLPRPTRVGYLFIGWFDHEDFDMNNDDLFMTVPTDRNEDLNFYAGWKTQSYELTYQTNGGTLTGGYSRRFTVEDGIITLPIPTGSTAFEGWYLKADFSGEPITEFNTALAKDTKIYAKWELPKYTVTFNANGGTVPGGTTMTYRANNGLITLPEPTLDGKYFVAWYETADFSGSPMWKFRSTTAANVTLYAKYADTEAEADAAREDVMPAHQDIMPEDLQVVWFDMNQNKSIDYKGRNVSTPVLTEDGHYVHKINFTKPLDGPRMYSAQGLVTSVDLSLYNSVTLWVYSERNTGGQFGLIMVPNDVGKGYVQLTITVNWEGWKQITVSFDDMSGRSASLPKSTPTWLWLTTQGWTYDNSDKDGDTVVYVDSICLTKTVSPYPVDSSELTKSDLTAVKDRFRNLLIANDTLRQDKIVSQNLTFASKAYINNWISSMNTSDTKVLWSDIGSAPANGSNIQNYYERIYSMARAYAGGAYREPQVLEAITNALEWMNTYAYNSTTSESGNWWHWEIGAATPLVNTLLVLEGDLRSSTAEKCLAALAHFTPAPKYTYANRTWTGYVALAAALLRGNAKQSVEMVKQLLSCFDYAPMVSDRDGFFEDGSFIQHKYTPYITGYGSSFIGDLTSIIYVLQNTKMALDQFYVDRFFDFFFDSYAPMLYQGCALGSTFGRNLAGFDPEASARSFISAAFKVVEFASDEDRDHLYSVLNEHMNSVLTFGIQATIAYPAVVSYRDFLAKQEAGEIAEESQVHAYLMTASDRVIEKTESYAAIVAMSSQRIYRYEAINGANGNGWYQGDGVLYVTTKNRPDAYEKPYFQGVDMTRLPGITATDAKRVSQVYTVDSNPFGKYEVVGGVSNDANAPLYSIAYMHFGADTSAASYKNGVEDLDAKKVWFFFDDEIVCLGSGITSTTGSGVYTVIDNRMLQNTADYDFLSDGRAVTFGTDPIVKEAVSKVFFSEFGGYYFPDATNLTYYKTGKYIQILLDHGVAPTEANYSYVMLPNMDKSQVNAYVKAPDIQILSNTSLVSAVKETKLGMTGIVFWEAGATFSSEDFKLTANSACSVMLTENEDGTVTFSVSEPTQKLNSITVTLEGVWNISDTEDMTATVVDGNTVITISTSNSLGATFTCTLSK